MIGPVERDEALGVPGHLVDPGRVVDPHDLVDGGVQDEQRPAQTRHDPFRVLCTIEIVEELLLHAEGATAPMLTSASPSRSISSIEEAT